MFVDVKDLPGSIQNALKSVGYHKSNIEVEIKEKAVLSNTAYADGYRGFTQVVNIATGESQAEFGSWGGANPFETKAVDHDNKEYVIPEGVAIIMGQSGHKVFASLILSPKNVVAGLLPSNAVVSKDFYHVLKVFKSIKPAYRQAELGGKDKVIEECIAAGYLKRDGRGTMITTAGKNAVVDYQKANNLPSWS